MYLTKQMFLVFYKCTWKENYFIYKAIGVLTLPCLGLQPELEPNDVALILCELMRESSYPKPEQQQKMCQSRHRRQKKDDLVSGERWKHY